MKDEKSKCPAGVTAIIVLDVIVIVLLALCNTVMIAVMLLPHTSPFKAGALDALGGDTDGIARLMGAIDFQLVFPILTLVFINVRKFVPVVVVQVIVVLTGIQQFTINFIPALVSLIILVASSNTRRYIKNIAEIDKDISQEEFR